MAKDPHRSQAAPGTAGTPDTANTAGTAGTAGTPSTTGTSRRGFLRSLALLAGAVATGSASGATAGVPGQGARVAAATPRRVGVLLPAAGAGQPGEHFLAGLRLGLAATPALQVELLSEDTGPDGTLGHRQASRLVTAYGAEVLVGLVGSTAEHLLSTVLRDAAVPLLASSLGELAPRRSDPNPYVFRHSLDQWRAEWALGSWAAGRVAQRAYLLGSLADGGYDLQYAFGAGFQAAGGTLVGSRVTDMAGPHDFDGAFAEVRETGAGLVYGLYGSAGAAAFLRRYAASGLGLPLLLGGGGVPDALLTARAPSAQGVRSARSWSVGLELPASRAFVAGYREHRGAAPDAFALLGYESGLVLAAAAEASAGQGRRALLEALRRTRVVGPRGVVRFDAQQRSVALPVYLHADREGRRVALEPLAGAPEQDERMAELAQGTRSGWGSPYLRS